MHSWIAFAPENASSIAAEVDALYLFLVLLTLIFSVLIAVAIMYFTVKYRRREENEVPEQIEGSLKLEIVWSVIPFLISMVIFGWGAKIYFDQTTSPKNAMDMYVVGKQWMWKFQHPEGQREINELHVPVNKKIRLIMATEDVIHSFFVPAFRVKQDIVPGPNRYSTLWFEPTKVGRYHIFCAEYCGTNHSSMIGSVEVMEPQDYENWLSGGAAEGSMSQKGEKLFSDLGCVTCHRSDAQGRAPMLDGLYGKQQQLIGGAKITVDESYVRESILDPTAKVVDGFQPIMPSFKGQVSEEQLLQLVAYVKSLGTDAAKAGAASATTNSGADAGKAIPDANPLKPNMPTTSTPAQVPPGNGRMQKQRK